MRIATITGCIVACCAIAAPLHAGDKKPNVKPGQWDTVVTMTMPGMPMAMPPVKTSKCLTQKDLTPDTSQPGQECKTTKQKIDGNNVEWAMKCKTQDGGTVTMSGKGTYKGETFTGTVEMDMAAAGGQAMKINASITSKRVGPCKKAKK